MESIDVGNLDDPHFEHIRDTVHEHGFVLFPNQRLTPDTIVACYRSLGKRLIARTNRRCSPRGQRNAKRFDLASQIGASHAENDLIHANVHQLCGLVGEH